VASSLNTPFPLLNYYAWKSRLGGSNFDDHDLEDVRSLADLATVVEKQIEEPGTLDRHIAAVSAVNAAVATIFPAVERPSFDARLIDVFRPYLSTLWGRRNTPIKDGHNPS